jgi:hypothetical protein
MEPPFSASDLWDALHLFMPPGSTAEIRALGAEDGGTCSGYFDDRQAAFQAASELSGKCEGIYITLNPVEPTLLARSNNRIRKYARYSSSDENIALRRLMVIDVDPVRIKGIASTDAEHETAINRAKEIRRALSVDPDWRDKPILASSGNGAHLIYPYPAPNSPQARDTLKTALLKLASQFSDGEAVVDAAMFNAARICRLYGTMARKGDPTPDRPHRIARILERQRDANH